MGDERTQAPQKDDSDLARPDKADAAEKKSASLPAHPSPDGLSLPAASLADIALTQDDVLHLQRTIGNRAVGRLIQAKLKVGPPGDEYEREADRVADRVMRQPAPEAEAQRQEVDEERRKRPDEAAPVQLKRVGGSRRASRKMMNPEEEQRKRPEGGTAAATPDAEAQIESLRGGGEQLPGSVRGDMEARLGQDFGQVRLHTGARAAEAAEAINARAYTMGADVVFGAGEYAPETSEGRRLLAHELTHVVQQGAAGERVQRYEAGEHAQIGETQDELKQAFAPSTYVVQKGERLSAIAKRFGLTAAELKAANKDKLRKWPAADGSGRMVEGFNAGETISIPQQLNDFAKAATKDKAATFTVNGVVLEYGVGIAMGDFYESPGQMAQASPDELKALAALVKREQSGGPLVTTEEWQNATNGRYLKLAEQNVPHFAPPDPTRVKPTPAGAAGPNHRAEWEKHHMAALEASMAGDKDLALMLNSYADHFLTDAFSAGHLINKPDVMELFKSHLKLDAEGEEFTEDSKKFFDAIAAAAFTGAVQTEFSKYETVKTYYGINLDIDSVGMFSRLLQGIHKERPDLVANAVAKVTHDRLNKLPGGLPVENAKGDPPSWMLSGDNTLNDDTRKVARKAVAQSQLNVISVYQRTGPLDTPTMFSRVWDYTPRPSAAGLTQLVEEVTKGTDIANAELRQAVVNLINENYMLIIDELVALNELKRIT